MWLRCDTFSFELNLVKYPQHKPRLGNIVYLQTSDFPNAVLVKVVILFLLGLGCSSVSGASEHHAADAGLISWRGKGFFS